jgi:hypothetical protein
MLPSFFSHLHATRRTPHVALLITGALVIAVAVFLPTIDVASSASMMFLFLFFLVNLCVIRIRRHMGDEMIYGFIMPLFPLPPVAAILVQAVLAVWLVHMSPIAWLVGPAWVIGGIAIYHLYAKHNAVPTEDEIVVLHDAPIPEKGHLQRGDIQELSAPAIQECPGSLCRGAQCALHPGNRRHHGGSGLRAGGSAARSPTRILPQSDTGSPRRHLRIQVAAAQPAPQAIQPVQSALKSCVPLRVEAGHLPPQGIAQIPMAGKGSLSGFQAASAGGEVYAAEFPDGPAYAPAPSTGQLEKKEVLFIEKMLHPAAAGIGTRAAHGKDVRPLDRDDLGQEVFDPADTLCYIGRFQVHHRAGKRAYGERKCLLLNG